MQLKILYGVAIVGILFGACAKTQNIQIKQNNLDRELATIMQDGDTTLIDDEEAVVTSLLKHSPSYAQKNMQKAQEKNIVKLPNNMPLYRQPLFAQVVIFPFVSKDGIYHGYSESWLKIKDGDFVLSDPKAEAIKERMFFYNNVGDKK